MAWGVQVQGPEWQSKGGREERATRLYSCRRGGRDKKALCLAIMRPTDKGFRESPDGTKQQIRSLRGSQVAAGMEGRQQMATTLDTIILSGCCA